MLPDPVGDVGLYALLDVTGLVTLKGLVHDVIEELDVALRDAVAVGVGHLRHLLPLLALEAVVDEPLADKLLGELTLRLPGLKELLIGVSVEVAARVGGVDLVDEVDLAVLLAKLVLRVDQDEPLLLRQLAAALKESERNVRDSLQLLGSHQPLLHDLIGGDIHVVPGVGLGGGGEDRVLEVLIFLHPLRQDHAAEVALAGLVGAPGATGEDGTDDHLELIRLAGVTDGDHGVGRGDLPVGDNVLGGIEIGGGDAIEDLALEGDPLGEDHVKGGDAVGGDHHEEAVVEGVYITDFAVEDLCRTRQLEVGMGKCLCHDCMETLCICV